MRGALLKKRYGIPVALLLVLLLCGTALAWYCFTTISFETTVEESLTVSETAFSTTIYPGESDSWCFYIQNSADVQCSVKAYLTAASEVSIECFGVDIADESGEYTDYIDETSDLKYDNSATFDIPIPAKGRMVCTMKISAAEDIVPGTVKVSFYLYGK